MPPMAHDANCQLLSAHVVADFGHNELFPVFLYFSGHVCEDTLLARGLKRIDMRQMPAKLRLSNG